MKRLFTTLIMTAILAMTIPALSTTASAQTRRYHRASQEARSYGYGRYGQPNYDQYGQPTYDQYGQPTYDQYGQPTYDQYGQPGYDQYGQPSVYDRHRKAINIGVATGVGAVLGALFGGKKGALIGAAAGVAGGAIVTAKQRPRNYYRY